MHTLITHIFMQSLPKKGFKQLTPFCSSRDDIEKGIYFMGYDGSYTLSEKDIRNSDDGDFYELPEPIPIIESNGVWINPIGEIYYGSLNTPEHTWVKIGSIT